MSVCWISYTTLYRKGGARLARAARTMAADKAAEGFEVILDRVESKRDFVDGFTRIADAGETICELHFVGHAGMYGPMFRTTAIPEQFSPHEWKQLVGKIPFTPRRHSSSGGDANASAGEGEDEDEGGKAWFHACRTARWFAPFFARTFGVPAHGYHWYTAFSTRPDRFAWEGFSGGSGGSGGKTSGEERPLYLIGCPGKKSHGLLASVSKYTGRTKAEPPKRFEPTPLQDEATYESVAELYDAVFEDIRVRDDEWRWIMAHLPDAPALNVLDIGCGNGALLAAMDDAVTLKEGAGVDASSAMIRMARRRQSSSEALHFQTIDGPTLPFEDQHFDVVTSLLSFRYLDWDPVMNEIRRVLKPGGKLLVVDMVTAPVATREIPQLVQSSARAVLQRATNRRYQRALKRLVGDPRWHTMLKYNPIRAQHEMVWYLQSRFPEREVEVLNVGRYARVLAFDSGPLQPGTVTPQSYP